MEGGGEGALGAAYSLGRQALEQGIGVLDLAAVHHDALLVLPRKSSVLKQAGQFLAECLSPFEMAQRGFRESVAALNFLNNMLESEVEKRTRAMRLSEERYRRLIEVSPDGITVSDLNGKIVLANLQSALLRGYSSTDEIIGSDAYDFIAPEDRARIRKFAEKVMRENIVDESEYSVLKKDGTYVPVETRATVLRDAEGRPNGILGINRDISERKRARLVLETQARSQAAVALLGQRALSGIDLSLLMHETVSVVAYSINVDHCELLELLPDGNNLILRDGIGWKEGLIGITEVQAGEDSQAGYTLLTGEPVIVEDLAQEQRFRPPALLTEHGIVSSITVIIHGKNQPYGILGAHTTQRRQFALDDVHILQSIANILAMAIDNRRLLETEARARQNAEKENEQRLKSLAIISHELRTPLTSIKGFASTLLAEDVTWDSQAQRDFIQTINEEADRLGNLIGQVLDLSKLEAGVLKYSPNPQYPEELVSAAMLHLQTLTRDHKLVISIPDTLPQVVADTQHIEQVLDNLVENATKYSPAETTIGIVAQEYKGYVKFSVSDEGPGISPSEREKIFQPFYRIQNNGTPKAKGAGLGLAICRRLIETQKGHIWVEENDGPGTMISFTLPLAKDLEHQNE